MEVMRPFVDFDHLLKLVPLLVSNFLLKPMFCMTELLGLIIQY